MRMEKIPYGQSHQILATDERRQVNVLRMKTRTSEGLPSEAEIIAAALAAPIGSPPLSELARGKKKVVIITSDHTRPVPSRLTLPPMLAEVRRASPEADITILIAVGSHRATTDEEMREKFGPELVATERIVNHDPGDESALISVGRLPSGGELSLNRLAVEADLLLADGFIEPHQFAGFSGGRKSVLPGVAALKSVLASHNAEFTVHPKARPGVLDGNPFQEDMLQAARLARLAFILNVTLSPDKRVTAAFAGEPDLAHRAGCRFVAEECSVKAAPAPIVVTSNGGYPLDQNIYQATKSMMAADLTCAPGGVIVAVNECRDGHGAEGFYETFRQAGSLDDLLKEISGRKSDETQPDQWVIQLTASILRRRRIILVSAAPPELAEAFGLIPAADLQTAMAMAEKMTGDPMSPVTVLPEAVSLIITE
ncbi:lactate racemization operon protein LarA [Deltaproteobacteria bacterium Smac51]|nr:lactate racemization operon protein LarA [Deltaproteobacteria bacterium Smac51]